MATKQWLFAGARISLASALLFSVVPQAFAQNTNSTVFGQNSTGPSQRVNAQLGQASSSTDIVPPLPHPEAILPDPFGWNTWLRNRGIAIMLDNTDEFGGVVTKGTPGTGLKNGSSNAGQYSVENDIDWERLAGITGFSTHFVGVGRYGIPASRMIGDNLNPSQEIYGGGGNVAFHFVYLYGEETLDNGHWDIAFGRFPFLNDFSSNPLYCNFMNNAFCGNPKPSSDNLTHSSYPDASWAGRIRFRPTKDTYIQTGAFFTNKGIYGVKQMRTGFKFNGADIAGAAVPIEIGWVPIFKNGTLPGHYKLGYARDTADHNDTYYDGNGNAYALTGLKPRIDHGSWSAWALADQMVYHHANRGPDAGLIVIGQTYFNSERTQTRGQQYSLGVIDHGFWGARPQDGWGLNFSYVRVSGGVGKTQALQQEMGINPLAYSAGGSNTGPLLNGAYGVQSYGMVLEALYQIHVVRGVTFAPDFQYYFRPGAQANLHDAAVIGFKSHIQLF